MATRRQPVKRKDSPRQDLLGECNEYGAPPRDFMQTFCRRCRNHACVNAGWSSSAWEQRMSTQVDRLLDNPNFADQDDPKYAELREQDFPSLLRQAIRLETADRNQDWAIPTTDQVTKAVTKYTEHLVHPPEEVTETETRERVDEAINRLAEARGKKRREFPDEATDEATDSGITEESKPLQKETARSSLRKARAGAESEPPPDSPDSPKPLARLPRGFIPDQSNTQMPSSGVMIGGAPRQVRGADPWGVPGKPKNVVEVGATVRMGQPAEDTEDK